MLPALTSARRQPRSFLVRPPAPGAVHRLHRSPGGMAWHGGARAGLLFRVSARRARPWSTPGRAPGPLRPLLDKPVSPRAAPLSSSTRLLPWPALRDRMKAPAPTAPGAFWIA